jgi:hypothetical protein
MKPQTSFQGKPDAKLTGVFHIGLHQAVGLLLHKPPLSPPPWDTRLTGVANDFDTDKA